MKTAATLTTAAPAQYAAYRQRPQTTATSEATSISATSTTGITCHATNLPRSIRPPLAILELTSMVQDSVTDATPRARAALPVHLARGSTHPGRPPTSPRPLSRPTRSVAPQQRQPSTVSGPGNLSGRNRRYTGFGCQKTRPAQTGHRHRRYVAKEIARITTTCASRVSQDPRR